MFPHSTVCSIFAWIVGVGDYLKMSPLSLPLVGVASLGNLQAQMEIQLHSLRNEAELLLPEQSTILREQMVRTSLLSGVWVTQFIHQILPEAASREHA